MRCYICDYSEGAPSSFYRGLSLDQINQKVFFDKHSNKLICQDCYDNSISLIDPIEEEEKIVV